jgi:nicotinate-nucleotide pyrophosphorylase (carboxylating)
MTFSIEQVDRNSVVSFQETDDFNKLFESGLALAIKEDLLGKFGCDLTTEACVPQGLRAFASIQCKEANVVIAGLHIVDYIFKSVDATAVVTRLVPDGGIVTQVPKVVATIECQARAMLTAERTVLNILQRMCGVATLTKKFVDIARPKTIKILDTRKTTPSLRVLERYAVKVGGGSNHRFGLADKILIKDNHIQIAGNVRNAIQAVRRHCPSEPIEVECATIQQVGDSLSEGVHTIMLDNMPPAMVLQAVALIDGKAFVEVSGGINLENLSDYLLPGVDGISIGALTHSARNIDLSLEVESIS